MLKPHTHYSFSKEDLEFVLELAKVGNVHLLSSQVELIDYQKSRGNNPHLSFKEFGGKPGRGCDGLKLPENWVIEGIYTDENSVSITFGVKKCAE